MQEKSAVNIEKLLLLCMGVGRDNKKGREKGPLKMGLVV